MIKALLHSKRILIQGSSGAGKSTLAITLGKILSLPVIHMDKEYWQPDWKKPNSEEWHQKQLKFIQNEKWIVEGGAYQRALPFRVQASDFVIYLEFNRFLCLYRCYKRYFTTRGKSRPDMPLGCVDQVDFSFVKWILHEQPTIAGPLALSTIRENLKHQNLVIFTKPSEVKNFLDKVNSKFS
jgi:adenylate kinase family enzyme